MKALTSLLHPMLGHPLVFELQERLCNSYDAVGREFADLLQGSLDVLDVGCSTGACAEELFDFDRHRYVGIDIAPAYVRLASARRPKGTFKVMDCRRLQFADASFNRALFVGVLHHLPDDVVRACLSEVRRVLRPEGRILVAEPLINPAKRLSHFFLKIDRGHYIRSRAGYEALFDGFDIERDGLFRFAIHRKLPRTVHSS